MTSVLAHVGEAGAYSFAAPYHYWAIKVSKPHDMIVLISFIFTTSLYCDCQFKSLSAGGVNIQTSDERCLKPYDSNRCQQVMFKADMLFF